MKLASLLEQAHCFPQIKARKLEPAFRETLQRLRQHASLRMASGKDADAGELVRLLVEREKKGSTALGSGVGYPHIRCEGFGDFSLALATCPQGLEDYRASDGQAVRLMLLAIVPPDKNSLLLGVVACLSRIMGDPALLSDLVNARTADALWRRLDAEGLRVTESIKAGEIMKRTFLSVPADMVLSDVAALMHKEHEDVLPVLDADGKLLGEVSASGLLATCLPPYFSQIPTMGFADDFDPFEHFFREKAHGKVSEILRRGVPIVSTDAPMTEVVAHLARQDIPRLYVVENDRLVGVIDSFSIIDKVLSI